jgi:hypothetical protein
VGMPRRLFVWVMVVGTATALAAIALNHSPGGVFPRIQAIANWLGGAPKPSVVTWPAWGYAFMIQLLPSLWSLVALQALVGVLAISVLADRLWHHMPRYRLILAALVITAVPWHNIQVELYPSALAGSFALLGLLALDMGLQRRSLAWSVLGGVFFGLGQNFRTEFLLLPVALCGLMWLLRRVRVVQFASVFPVVAAAAVALAMQVP